MNHQTSEVPIIVFFDGVCTLCDGAVNFIVKWGKSEQIKVTPLQSKTAEQHFQGKSIPDSLVVFDGKDYSFESEAVLKIAENLGGFWGVLAKIAARIPVTFRNWIYRFIAKNRYRILPKKKNCRIPTERDRAFFLP